jgi:hypothetical protein
MTSKVPFHGPEYSRNLPFLSPSDENELHNHNNNNSTIKDDFYNGSMNPTTTNNNHNVDILAETLHQLSVQEREHVFEDVHGVATMPHEDPAHVQYCLAQLDYEISQVPNRDAYLQARAMNVLYVDNRTFRLQFLRSTSFHVRHAAIRMVSYFEAKRDLFGSKSDDDDDSSSKELLSLLARNIRQSDLNELDLECLQNGYAIRLPVPDHAGRLILVGMPWKCNRADLRLPKVRGRKKRETFKKK